MLSISEIASQIEADLVSRLNGSGIMYRLFSRTKTLFSIRHKMQCKGENYRKGTSKIQDIIGLRVVVYFSDDVEALSLLINNREVVKRSIDEPDSCTFSPQRLNFTSRLPEQYVHDFRAQLPDDFAQYIDDTYEIQIRTVFSEGWHEVEHDMRYKCKEDWVGYETYSRTLNGVIATLETAEWSMKSLFQEMAMQNLRDGNYTAMLRNKLRIRLKGNGLSPEVDKFLQTHPHVASAAMDVDRVIFLLTLLSHKNHVDLTYDNVLFLINRLEIQDKELKQLEGENFVSQIKAMFLS